MLEDRSGNAAAVEHEIFADDAAGIGQTVGELLTGGKKQQARSFRAIGADDNGFGLLQMRVALFVEVDSTGNPPVAVRRDAMNVRIRTNLAAGGFFSHADGGGQRARYGADFTTKPETQPAIGAGAAPRAGLRKNGHWCRERMPAELPSGALENHAGTFHRQRRHGIGLGARRIEGAGAGQAGDTNFPFDLGVVGLEIGVGYGPIAEVRSGDGANFAALDE